MLVYVLWKNPFCHILFILYSSCISFLQVSLSPNSFLDPRIFRFKLTSNIKFAHILYMNKVLIRTCSVACRKETVVGCLRCLLRWTTLSGFFNSAPLQASVCDTAYYVISVWHFILPQILRSICSPSPSSLPFHGITHLHSLVVALWILESLLSRAWASVHSVEPLLLHYWPDSVNGLLQPLLYPHAYGGKFQSSQESMVPCWWDLLAEPQLQLLPFMLLVLARLDHVLFSENMPCFPASCLHANGSVCLEYTFQDSAFLLSHIYFTIFIK